MPVIIECTLPPIINIMSHIIVKYPNKKLKQIHISCKYMFMQISLCLLRYTVNKCNGYVQIQLF